MSLLADDAEILRKRGAGGTPAVGRNLPFAHVACAARPSCQPRRR